MPPGRAADRPRRNRRQRGTASAQNDPTEALGRSRGGLTCKLHLAGDGRGRPLSIVVTERQRHDSTQLARLLDGIRVPRPGGRGRPRKRPDHLVGDKGYSYAACRQLLRAAGSRTPSRSDRPAGQADRRPGRPLTFDWARYRGRNVAERGVNKLKQWRGIAARYDQRAGSYRAAVVLAALVVWLAS